MIYTRKSVPICLINAPGLPSSCLAAKLLLAQVASSEVEQFASAKSAVG